MALNFHHLHYFWIVAREGNLTRAAQKNNVAQSALSTQIRALEQYLGQPLFRRDRRRLILTEAGQIALDFADAIFAKGDELLGTLGRLQESQQDVMRVGALATLSRNFQIEFLGPLLTAENVTMTIRSGTLTDLLAELENYQLDVVLSTTVPMRDESTRWVAHAIANQPVSLVGQPVPDRRGAAIDDLLRNERLIVPATSSSIRTGFDALVNRLGITPHIVAQVDDMAMLRLVARRHAGLTIVPPIVVKDELDAGVLVEVAKLPGLSEAFFAITLERRFPNPLLELVLPKTIPALECTKPK